MAIYECIVILNVLDAIDTYFLLFDEYTQTI